MIRRSVDIVLAAALLVVVALPMAAVAIAVRRKLGAPALFRQERIGLNERSFTLLKFRSMSDARDSKGALLPDAERLTPFGRWLRATSLDELPQLLNILKGDMTFVGPRPLLPEYLPLYSPEQRRRHTVRPGITGWAQVNGRNSTTWDARFRHDLWYVDNRDVFIDLSIVRRTVARLVFKRSAAEGGDVIMARFEGTSASPRTLETGAAELAIIGCGGHGRAVADWARAQGVWTRIVFYDDARPSAPVGTYGGTVVDLLATSTAGRKVVVAIGNATARLDLLNKLSAKTFAVARVIHPRAVISETAEIGLGAAIGPQAVLGAGAHLGDGVIVNSGAIVEHDCRLGDGVHIAPGAALGGQVTVGARSWIGIGSSVRQSLAIGADVTVGAGAAVVAALPDGVTAVGVPARVRSA